MIILFFALLADWYFGEPDILWRRLRHPVIVFGGIIDKVDIYRQKKDLDLFFGILLLIFFFVLALVLHFVLYFIWWPFAFVLECFIVFVLLAQKSLYQHVQAVMVALQAGDLALARLQVAKIVGRDIENAGSANLLEASIESLSENYSDGVLAPLFYYCLFGVAGIVFYKAVNTCDSMIGKRDSKYEMFGKASALLDDVLNYLPSRLSVLIIAFVCHFLQILQILPGQNFSKFIFILRGSLCDGGNHSSLNAGYPQAAYAYALNICLGNERYYGGVLVSFSPFNATGRGGLEVADMQRALFLFRACCFFVMAFVLVLALLNFLV